jgi:N-acetylmuramoyl-L-alanine amidase
MPIHIVKQGHCLHTIAAQNGMPWEKIWNAPDNAVLKQQRLHPNILLPGDKVVVPELEQSQAPTETQKKHIFKLGRPKLCIRLKLMSEGNTLKNIKYQLEIDGNPRLGETDGDGLLTEYIDPTAVDGILMVSDDPNRHVLHFGFLDPLDTTSGLQGRINNLGFDCGSVDGDWGANTRGGMQAFQSKNGLTQTTKVNDETLDLAHKQHGS